MVGKQWSKYMNTGRSYSGNGHAIGSACGLTDLIGSVVSGDCFVGLNLFGYMIEIVRHAHWHARLGVYRWYTQCVFISGIGLNIQR